MSRRKNYTNHHRQEVNLRIEDQAYLQATSLKGTKHFHVKGKLTPRFIGPLQDHCKTKNRRLPARVITWVTHCAQRFSTRHHSGNVSNFLTSPVSTRTSTTSHRPPAQYDLRERPQLQSGSSRTTNTKPRHRVLQGSMEHQTEAEAVWGREDYPKSKFPYSFPRLVWESRGRDSCKGGRSVTPWFSCHNT